MFKEEGSNTVTINNNTVTVVNGTQGVNSTVSVEKRISGWYFLSNFSACFL